LIDGVKFIRLQPHVDDRGYLIEILRATDEHFKGFGQVYLTTCYPGIVKAWHAHAKQTDNFFVVKGNAKIGLYDDREGSPTRGEKQSIVIGEQNPVLVQIPPLVWHGQMAVGPETSYLINVPTEVYNPKEPDEMRRDPFDPAIGFDWLPKSR